MGSSAHATRADRFMDEFGDDFARRSPLKPETKLTVLKNRLYQDDGNEQVLVGTALRDSDGHVFWLNDGYPVFDPELDRGQGMIERVAVQLAISPAEAKRRLEKAGVLGQAPVVPEPVTTAETP